jgi:esterase/lipase superfamily enzyme
MSVSGVWAMSKRRLVAIAALIALAGCAGPPKGVLTPVVAGAPQTDSVEMIVATMRDPTDEPAEMFSGERGLHPAFATITVSIPPPDVHAVGSVEWPKRLPPDPAKEFAVLTAEQIDREAARAWFHDRVAKAPGRSTLIFVHGFNNRFEDAVFRFAQIAHDSNMEAVPVLFTWPSRGSLLAYGYDRESTNYSRDALELLLQVLARDPSVGEVSILAHSMGNWVTMEALRQMSIRNGRIAPKIRNVMMAAPDVDVDVFRVQIEQMGTPRPSFTLFVSQDDRALAVSRRVWGDVARLGAIDPETEPYKTELANYGITVIDLTKLKADDATHHSKFAQSPEIVQLIGTRLASGQPITDTHVGLGEHIIQATAGMTATVGAAAGLAIAAPVAIVDPTTRENFGKHVGAIAGAPASPGSAQQRCSTAPAPGPGSECIPVH